MFDHNSENGAKKVASQKHKSFWHCSSNLSLSGPHERNQDLLLWLKCLFTVVAEMSVSVVAEMSVTTANILQ